MPERLFDEPDELVIWAARRWRRQRGAFRRRRSGPHPGERQNHDLMRTREIALLGSRLRVSRFHFALGGKAGAELALALGRQRSEPGQGVRGRERQRAAGEARGDRAADVAAVEAEGSALARASTPACRSRRRRCLPAGSREPPEASLEINPDALPDPGQHLLHRDRAGEATGGVEHAGAPLLGQADGPFGQIAESINWTGSLHVARRRRISPPRTSRTGR